MTPVELTILFMTVVTVSFWYGKRQGHEEGRYLGVEDTLRYMMTNNYITDEGLKWMDLMSEKYMEQDDE